jgi:hypothetical protein
MLFMTKSSKNFNLQLKKITSLKKKGYFLVLAMFRIRIRIQSGQWIRIWIRNPDPDPGEQK